MLQIVRSEDERRWDDALVSLLRKGNSAVRRRAALAAGRIGDESAVLPLISLLQNDKDDHVRALGAFALGEIEAASGVDALTAELAGDAPAEVRARAVEALGKIAAALPTTEEARKRSLGKVILDSLRSEAQRRSTPDSEVILLGMTAALRARPEQAGKVIAGILSYSDTRVQAYAANVLARLRANDGNKDLLNLLSSAPDPIVRANAARVLGATEDKGAFDALLDRALQDMDSRVRVSALRALGSLKDARAAEPLRSRGSSLMTLNASAFENRGNHRGPPLQSSAGERSELLEIAGTLGQVLLGTENEEALAWYADYVSVSATPLQK